MFSVFDEVTFSLGKIISSESLLNTYNKFCMQSGLNSRVSLKPFRRYLKSINNLIISAPACHSYWSTGHMPSVAQLANSLLLLP